MARRSTRRVCEVSDYFDPGDDKYWYPTVTQALHQEDSTMTLLTLDRQRPSVASLEPDTNFLLQDALG